MNKIVLTLALATVCSTGFAQKGSFYVGGAAGFSTKNNSTDNNGNTKDGVKQTSWSFSPEVGTFLTDNLSVGIGLNFTGSKADARTTVKNITTTSHTGATLYARNFFGKNAFKPFVGLNVSILPGSGKTELGPVTTKTKLMDIGANLNAGFAYALSPRVTVVGSVATLGFASSTSEVEGSNVKNKSTEFGLDANTLGNRFNVGVYYTFLQ
ncbi:MAG: outer membrane beta-barrel protein [Bacteroidetes bacterium]|nr:outer membrane beta-barrel protein [Bacteroidota bacterium]